MLNYEKQKREIETVKPRAISIELSDADIKRLFEKAYANGITPARLISDYIGDLVDGTYTHGSDERTLASEYFDRCCYDLGLERDFLQWAISDFRIDEIVGILEDIEGYEKEIAYYEENRNNPDEPQAESEIAFFREEIAGSMADLDSIYEEYASESKKPQTLEAGLEAVKAYRKELLSMLKNTP